MKLWIPALKEWKTVQFTSVTLHAPESTGQPDPATEGIAAPEAGGAPVNLNQIFGNTDDM